LLSSAVEVTSWLTEDAREGEGRTANGKRERKKKDGLKKRWTDTLMRHNQLV